MLAYLVITYGFISNKHKAASCNEVILTIKGKSKIRYIERSDIFNLFEAHGIYILGNTLNQINTKQLEEILNTHKLVKNAEAYRSECGNMHIDIIQRIPLLRVFSDSGNSYYLDKEGVIIPVSEKYPSFVLVASGHIHEDFNPDKTYSILSTGEDRARILKDLLELALYMNKHKFWNAQIEQIYVTENGAYELIPRVGPHIIELGTILDHKKKLNNLMILYREGFNKIGWNDYLRINLRYENQIVCTKN
jgi:cell division protein FtsQ